MELRHIIAVGKPRASVLLLHGYGEHTGRHSAFIEVLAAGGYDVFFYDQPSHGTADGPAACVDVAELINVHLMARMQVRARMRTESLILFGHSMGGLITAASALIRPDDISAVVLSGPAFRQYPELPPLVSEIGYKLAGIMPCLPVARLDSSLISRDPAAVERYERDPLVYHGRVPLLTGASMAVQGRRTLDNARRWRTDLPLFIVHGSADGLANIDGSQEFAAAVRLAGAPVDFVDVAGGYHEVFNDIGREKLEEQLLWWLDQQNLSQATRALS